MVFLPIVNRELRVAARRPRTYYGRMAAAAVWAALAAYFLVVMSIAGFRRSDGMTLFRTVSGALFIWAVICTWVGADSISVEKREGTIGFLFLTDLKSHDIVLGKMVAAALPSFYGAVAILPLLAICLMMGGVTVWQYAKAGLAILDVFFLGQAVGIFSSALCRKRENVSGLPFLVLLLYVAASNLASMVASLKGWMWPAFLFEYNNPAHPFSMAMRGTIIPLWTIPRVAQPGYWIPLLIVNLHGWIFLALATWVLPRRWRDQPKKEGIWRARWDRWRFGSLATRTAFRKKLVTVNPMLWLVCRGRFSPAFAWSVMGTVALSIVALSIWAITMNSWREVYAGCFICLIITLQLMVRVGVASRAGLLEEQRRSGSLETMLYCSPMSVDEILNGVRLVVRRYYRYPVLVLVVTEIGMFIAALITGFHNIPWMLSGNVQTFITAFITVYPNIDLLLFIGVSTILLIPDLRAIAWMAMWTAMSNPRPRSAASSAFAWITLIPWALVGMVYAIAAWINARWFGMVSTPSPRWVWIGWLTIALLNDFFVIRLAKKRLHKNFRLWASSLHAEVLGFWGRLGRLLGLLWRRCKPR